ncbi:unannotated protein [freshwater metagenome]|uniref:Unannotated protein n=1 Tax=freshwater metagenome TaxID=449393 RepID=A0A6J5YMQ3_9ZZZZ
MDLPALDVGIGERRIEGLADDVEDVAEHGVAHRHGDAVTEVAHRRATTETVGGLHGDHAHPAVADLLGHLGDDDDVGVAVVEGHLNSGVDLGKSPTGELNVDHRAGDGDNSPILEVCGVLGDGHRGLVSCVRRSVDRSRRVTPVEVFGEKVLR